MVYFELFYRSELLLKYYYWPENDRNSEPGIAVVELNTGNIYIEKIAALDFKKSGGNSRGLVPEMKARLYFLKLTLYVLTKLLYN